MEPEGWGHHCVELELLDRYIVALISVYETRSLGRLDLNHTTGSIPFSFFPLPTRQSTKHPLHRMSIPFPTNPVARRALVPPRYLLRLGRSALVYLSAAFAERLCYRWSGPPVALPCRPPRVPLALLKRFDSLQNDQWQSFPSVQRAMGVVFFDLLTFLKAITFQ